MSAILKMSAPAQPQPAPTADQDGERWISIRELCSIMGISRSNANRLKAAHKLPPHVEWGNGTHRWRRATVLAWLAERERLAQSERKRSTR